MSQLQQLLKTVTDAHENAIDEVHAAGARQAINVCSLALVDLKIAEEVRVGPYALLVNGRAWLESDLYRRGGLEADVLDTIHDTINSCRIPSRYFTGEVLHPAKQPGEKK